LLIIVIRLGGWWFACLIAGVLTVAVVEFCQLMKKDQYQPDTVVAVALLAVLLLDAQLPTWNFAGPGISLVLMASLTWQMAHRQGKPVTDWALSLIGGLYVGWLGVHLIRIRNMPEGIWWLLTTLVAVWLADSGAYFIGRTWGRHKMAPTLSPKKTWEGYGAGIVVGALTTAGAAALWSLRAGPTGPTALKGLVLGLIVAIVTPLGDLAISMVKRQANIKDSGALFPGHGGALDRLDSLLWAVVIGYYFALWLGGL
jgi:phosphatidate cytidylyltransferase